MAAAPPLAEDRLARIRHELEARGQVRIDRLSRQLRVSEMTVRRDLEILENDGVLRRVRGGGVAVGPEPFAERAHQHAKAKAVIGRKLADLVTDDLLGGAIGLDASSTVARLAPYLPRQGLTVLTNSTHIFMELQLHSDVIALLTGGRMDPRTGSLVGPLACRAATAMVLRQLFLSAAAVSPEHGACEATLEESEVKLALAASAEQVILAVDSSKLDSSAPARGLAFDRIDALVTELDAHDARLAPYRELVRVI